MKIIFSPAKFLLITFLLTSATACKKQSSSSQSSENARVITAKATKEFWDKMQQIEKAGDQKLEEMHLGEYPKLQTGFFDFQHFDDTNFTTLRDFYAKKAQIQFETSKNFGALSTLNVDEDLVSYWSDRCDGWQVGGKNDFKFAAVVSTLYEQRTQFTSDKAYAQRMLSASSGDRRIEDKYKESQSIIDGLVRDWIAQRTAYMDIYDKMQKRERETKALMTRRYGTDFR